MKGSEVLKELQQAPEDKCFIKWWRQENDFSDYELIENFLADVRPHQEFAGYELLNLEEMWLELQKVGAARLAREKRRLGEVIVWDAGRKAGTRTCPFTAGNLMTIFDVETRGNVID